MTQQFKHTKETGWSPVLNPPTPSGPQPGQWWVCNDDFDKTVKYDRIYFIVGYTPTGRTLIEDCNGDRYEYIDRVQKFYHHEPNCTGFNWTSPKPKQPVKQFTKQPITLYISSKYGLCGKELYTLQNDQVTNNDIEVKYDPNIGFYIETISNDD